MIRQMVKMYDDWVCKGCEGKGTCDHKSFEMDNNPFCGGECARKYDAESYYKYYALADWGNDKTETGGVR